MLDLNDTKIDFLEAKAVIQAASHEYELDVPIDINPEPAAAAETLIVGRKHGSHRYNITIPPVVEWHDLARTMALLLMLWETEQREGALWGEGSVEGLYKAYEGEVEDACRAAVAAYRAKPPAVDLSVFA